MFLNKKKTAFWIFALAVFLLALDRFLKILALNYQEEYNLIGDILQFSFAKNYFIAFSLPLGGVFLMVLICVIILSLLAYAIKCHKDGNRLQSSLLFTTVLGAISNLQDRLQYGYVIDYIDLKYFTVFNVADSMIVVSVFFLVFLQYFYDKKEPPQN